MVIGTARSGGDSMKKVVVGVLATLGALSLLAVVAGAGIWMVTSLAKPGVPSRTILEIDLEGGVIEGIPDDAFAQLMLEDSLTVHEVVEALDRGAEDRRVKAVVARIGGGGMGLAHIQELRDAVLRFRASGKPAIAYAETFGEFGPGNGGYYLATAFDEIYLQPSGDIGLTGLMYESMFVRGLLDKLGVVPRMNQRYEYKNAMNMYTERSYTSSHREAMQRLVDSQFDQMVRGIAEARDMTEEQVRETFDRGPYLGGETVTAGLVDGLKYRHEVYAHVQEQAGEDAKLLYVKPYLERAGKPHRSGETVAFIQGYGMVIRGKSAFSPLDGSVYMGSDTVTQALRAAIDDRRVKAIVLRVDSPGGSYVASDTIWRETLRAKEAGKPLIVSMGNVAGSGGYFVAMHADRIVAEPGTITASIGVLGGKLLTEGMWDKVGISYDDVQSSANASQWSALHDYSAQGRERFEAALDRIYEDFTSKVAEGRGLALEKVQQVAKGRIWTGEDALELGLVDELGGVEVALRLVREQLGLAADAPLRLKRFPVERSTFQMLFGEKPDNSERAALGALVDTLREVQPTVRMLRQAVGVDDGGVLSMPELELAD